MHSRNKIILILMILNYSNGFCQSINKGHKIMGINLTISGKQLIIDAPNISDSTITRIVEVIRVIKRNEKRVTGYDSGSLYLLRRHGVKSKRIGLPGNYIFKVTIKHDDGTENEIKEEEFKII